MIQVFLWFAFAAVPTFHGHPCTQDCSGHEAGYMWAEEHDIADPDDCGGKSASFIDGCRIYAEEWLDEAGDPRDDDDCDPANTYDCQ